MAINKEKSLTLADLPSSKHRDPRTFVAELKINHILPFNNQKNHYFQITDFENISPDKTIIHGRCLRRVNDKFIIVCQQVIPPDLNARPFDNTYVGYSQQENNVLILGTAGENQFTNIPKIRIN